jgi:O-antigen/teichoic acid export membrane protein
MGSLVRSILLRGKAILQRDTALGRVLTNSGWLLSANTLSMVLSLIQGIIVARALGAEQYGVLALITTFATTINQFVDSRVWEVAIRFIIRYREQGDYARATATVKFCYLVDLVTGLLAFVIILLTAQWGAHVFVKDPSASSLIKLYALSVIIAVPVGTSSALLRVGNHFDWLAYQNVITAAFTLVGVIFALVLDTGIKGLLVVYLLAAALGMSVLVLLGKRLSQDLKLKPWRHAPLRLLRGEYGQILRFLASTNGNALVKLLQRNLDTLLIGYWLGPVDVGYYRVARRLTNLIAFPVGPLYTASYPEFVRLWDLEQVGTLRHLMHKLTLSSTAVGISAAVAFWLGGRWIILLTVGDQYLPAFDVLQWLVLGMVFAVATNFFHPLLLAMDRAFWSFLAMVSSVMAQLTVLVLLLPRLGIVAAGMAYAIGLVIWTMLGMIAVRLGWRQELA